jgi:AraC-like DNA-binding protein
VARITREVPDALIGVFSSDHAVADPAAFLSAWQTAESAAEAGYIALFGIAVETGVVMVVYIDAAFHRRLLAVLNDAVAPEDLMYEKAMVVHAEGGFTHQGNPLHEDNPEAMKMKRRMLMSRETAERVLAFRDKEFPLGFRNLTELLTRFDLDRFRHLFMKETGVGFRAYLLWQRLECSLAAYVAGETLTEAAHTGGFADSAHFSRTFRRMFGIAPASVQPE